MAQPAALGQRSVAVPEIFNRGWGVGAAPIKDIDIKNRTLGVVPGSAYSSGAKCASYFLAAH